MSYYCNDIRINKKINSYRQGCATRQGEVQLPGKKLIKIIAFLKTFGKIIRVRDLGRVEGGRTGRLLSATITEACFASTKLQGLNWFIFNYNYLTCCCDSLSASTIMRILSWWENHK